MDNEENEVKPDKPQKPFVKSVLEFQSRIKLYEKIILSLALANTLIGVMLIGMIFSNPLVILESDGEKLSFKSNRKEITITEKEIKKLVENFIRRRFEWDKFSIEAMMANLTPIVSSGLKSKIAEELAKEEKASKYSAFSQCRISNMGTRRFPERGPARTTAGQLMCG